MLTDKRGRQINVGPMIDGGHPVVMEITDDGLFIDGDEQWHQPFIMHRRVMILSMPKDIRPGTYFEAADKLDEETGHEAPQRLLRQIGEAMEVEL